MAGINPEYPKEITRPVKHMIVRLLIVHSLLFKSSAWVLCAPLLGTDFMLLRHALSARVTNWTSYRVLDAEIALPRICLS